MNHKVLIMRCDEYDPDKIAEIIKNGMEELDVRPSGNIMLKPNVVIAHPEKFPNAFTRSEFLDGAIKATKDMATNAREISVGERSGITLPTRFCFKMAGYYPVIKKHKVKAHHFDEAKQIPYEVKQGDRLRDTMFFPKPVVDCDFLINLPKFKAHPWCRLTLSLKNFIGIQDDRHRLVDHNLYLEHKIADLQEVIQPKFIAIDAIVAGQKTMLTPDPFDMGAIVMGTNSCAVDTVCCHMVHVDPKDLIHLKFASERGYGPIDINDIDVGGDFPLDEVKERTKNFEFLLEHVDTYFEKDSNLSCNVGTFPAAHSPDYCWGGCPGALQEAIHIVKTYYPDALTNMKKVRYVVGKVDHPLDLDDDEKVMFVGNCTSWEGEIDGEHVKIESKYKSPRQVDEKKTKSNDMVLKTAQTLFKAFVNRKKRWVHVKGCTVSVADHVHYLSVIGDFDNPLFEGDTLFPMAKGYILMLVNRFINRFIR